MSLLIMILLISMLIVVHEAGHFIAAKAFGIAVPKFGFGLPFGPVLFKKKIGETEILLHAFLLGGYVSFLDDEEHPEIPKDSPLRFQNKTIWQRAIVVSAGVIANVIMAFLIILLIAIFVRHLPSSVSEVYVDKIVAQKDAPVWSIGLKEGDMLYTINDTPVVDVSYLGRFAKGSHKFNDIVEEERVQEKLSLLKQLNPNLAENDLIEKGTVVTLPPFDDEAPVHYSKNNLIVPDEYSKKSGVVKLTSQQSNLRDKIYNQRTFTTFEETSLEDIATAISDTTAPLLIKVKRNDEIVELKPLYVDTTGTIGVRESYKPVMRETKSFKSVFVESAKYIFEQTYLMILSLVMLFNGQVPVKELHGIIVITKVGSDIISTAGMFKGLILTSLISLNLAIMNLLPIPALDGGHLLFLMIEKIRGKALDEKILEKISSIFFTLLIVLLCFVLANDVYALITKKF